MNVCSFLVAIYSVFGWEWYRGTFIIFPFLGANFCIYLMGSIQKRKKLSKEYIQFKIAVVDKLILEWYYQKLFNEIAMWDVYP